ncbi:unnamed protein product [Phytophthora fragariaefolia]|uniref:Unnamed protein product n=1 Tax=Phytophthora fragariaefolia TaxID=1490495 RepID=A0A9W6UFF5_9STRA|nr:unnamed protein product [Phytophthora fragariaefolia]
MHGSVEISLVAGYSGELQLGIWSASVEAAYLAAGVVSGAAVARATRLGISVTVAAICHAANVVVSPMAITTRPMMAVPIQVIGFTFDMDGSEVLSTQVMVNKSAVLSLYGLNASENLIAGGDTAVLPRLDVQPVFRLNQTFNVVPRADFVGFFIVNVTVKTTELATGDTKTSTVLATVLVAPVDPVVRISSVSHGYWNEFVRLPFQRLDVQQEVTSREHFLLFVENRTQLADIYAGFKRLIPVTLGAVDLYVIPYTLRDVISVRPREYWYGFMKLFAIVTTVTFDIVSAPNCTAYQGAGDGIVIMDIPVVVQPRPIAPSSSLAVSPGSGFVVAGKPIAFTFDSVFPYDSWGRLLTGGMVSQLAISPLSVLDSLSPNVSMVVKKAALRGFGGYGLYSTGNISGDTHLRFLMDGRNSYSGLLLATMTTNTTDVLQQTMMTNVSNTKLQVIGEADRGALGFGKSIRVFQVGDNQNVTFRLADFGLMSELTDLVSVQALIVDNAVDGVFVGSTFVTGEADAHWGAAMKFGDLRYELHGSTSPSCLPSVEPSCFLSRIVTVIPRKYAAQTFNVTMKIVSNVSVNNTTFGSLSSVTTFARCRVVVAPVPNTPVLVLNTPSVTTLEDIVADFTIVEASTPDRDGSEVIEVDISFDPLYIAAIQLDGLVVATPATAGTVVLVPRGSAASITTNRIVSLLPRRNFAGNFTLQISVTSIEGSTGDSTRISTSIPVTVIAVADAPVLQIGTADIRVNQTVSGEFTVTSIALTDLDNSETLQLVIVDQTGSALKAVEMSGGARLAKDSNTSKFVLASLPATSDNLIIQLTPEAAWFGSTQLQISAVSRETSNSNEATTLVVVTFTVLPVADMPTLVVENTRGQLSQATRIGIVSVGISNVAKLNATSLAVYLVPRSTDLVEVKWQSQVLSLENVADIASSGSYRLPSTTTLQQPTVTVSSVKWVSSITFDIIVVASISVSRTSQRTSQAATVTFAAVQLSSSSLNLTEGATGSLSLALLSVPLSAVTVTFATSLATRADVVPTAVVFTTTDWNVAKSIQISAVNNFIEDPDAVATFSGVTRSSDAVYSGYQISAITVQVFNDDFSGFAVYQGSTKTTAPTLVVAEGRVFSDTYNIVLLAQPTADVSVTLSTSLSILVVSPTSVTFTASTWNVPRTISVAANDNSVVDGGRTATISSVVSSFDTLYSSKTIDNLNVKVVETKDTTPPPKILDAKFLDTAVGLTITLDRAVDRTMLVPDNFACSVLFDLPTATDSTNYCGTTPACTWQTGSLSIRFVFGPGAKIVPGSTLVLRANLLKSTATAELAAPTTSIIVSAPDKSPQPQVLVSGATSLGMCDDLFLDGSSSSGSGGRSMTYTWMLVSTSSVTSGSVDVVKALLASAATTNNATIKIAAATLEADSTYSFVLLANNFLGKTGNSNEIVIKKSGMALPSVSIKGGGLQGAYRASELVISASATYPSCSGAVSTDSTSTAAVSTGVDMTFTWLQVTGDLTASQFKSTSPNPRILKLPAATLTVGVNYVFRLLVAMTSNAKVNNTADVQIVVARTDLTPHIAAGNRSVGVEQDLVLDASVSTDPDDPHNDVPMHYVWACSTFNSASLAYDIACLTAVGGPLVLDAQAKVTVPANTVNPKVVYKFAVTVSKDSRSSTTSVFITMTPGSPPQVSIEPLSTAKVNVNDRVILKGNAVSKLPVTKTEWSIVGASAATMNAIFAIQPPTRLTMLLNQGKLTPGVSYKFQLNVTDSSGQIGSATITVVANSPPSSGSLTVTPSVGYALEDKFTVLASDWVDEDLPLKYTFKYIKGSTYSGESEVALGASTPDALFVSQLGLGGGDNSTITIVVYVQDSFGATTRLTKEIQVKQMVVATADQAAYLANKTSAVLAEALSGDPGTVLNTINALADMVNGDTETTTSTSTGGTVSTPAPTSVKSCPTSNSVECAGKGTCLREPKGCLSSNLDCIVTCVCNSGYYGENCGLDEAAMAAKSAALGSLLGAMSKASGSVDLADVGAVEQQAASVVTLTKSATILDTKSQKLVLNVMDSILAAPVLTPAATTAVGNTISNLLEVDNSGSNKNKATPTTTTSATKKNPASTTPTPTATTKTPTTTTKSRRLDGVEGSVDLVSSDISDSSTVGDAAAGNDISGSGAEGSAGSLSAGAEAPASSNLGSTTSSVLSSSASSSTSSSDEFAAEKAHAAQVASTIEKLQTAMLLSAIAGEAAVTLVTKNLRIVGKRDTASNFEGQEVQLPLTEAQIAANYTPASTTIPTGFAAYLKRSTNSASGASDDDPVVDVQSNVYAKNPYAFDNTTINSRVMTVKVSRNGKEVGVSGLETPFRLFMRNLVAVTLISNDSSSGSTGSSTASGSNSNSSGGAQRYNFYCLEGTIDIKYFNCTDIDEPMTVQCNGSTYAGEATCPVRQPLCSYWDLENGTWSSEGCQAAGTTDDGVYTICECTHLTDFSTEMSQSVSLVTEHFMDVVTHKVTADDVQQNLPIIMIMAGFFLLYILAIFYVNRWDYRDRRKAKHALRLRKRGSAPPEKVKLRSLFQEPEYLQAKNWRTKTRAVVVGFGRGLKEHHKLLSIIFKYHESFSRAQRLTVVFTLIASHMFTNALLYKLKTSGNKSLASAIVSAVVTMLCMIPVGFVFMMMFKKAGRMHKYLIRYQVEDDEGNIVEVETDAYGRAKEYSPAEQMSMDLAALARDINMSSLRLVHEKLKQPGLAREDGSNRDRLETRCGQVCRGIFLALYNRDADVKPPQHVEGNGNEDPLTGVLVHIKSHLQEQKTRQPAEDDHRRTRLLSTLPFGSVKRNSSTASVGAGATITSETNPQTALMPPAAPVMLGALADPMRIEEGDDEEETMDSDARKKLARSQLCTMLKRNGGEALINSMLKFDPLLVSAVSAEAIADICKRLDLLEQEEDEEEEEGAQENDGKQSRPQTRGEDEETKTVLALQAWLVKCNECCEAQQSNVRVVVAKAQAELQRTETQLKKLRTAIGNQFDKRITDVMALELNGPNVNELIVKTRQSVRRVSKRPANAMKAEASVKEEKRRINVTIKKETQAVLRANKERVMEKRKAIKKAKRAAIVEQRRLQREAKHEQRKIIEGLRGISRLKKRLQLYLEAREERRVAALPLHERQAYLAEKEQLKKIRRTSRLLYNAFLRRQPAQQSKPFFPEWVVYLSYTVCAIWNAWCVYFVFLFACTVGHVDAQLWITSLLAGLALTYLISDPMKLFFRMGIMPIIAAGILADSGFFSALSPEPIALGAAAVAAGAGGMAGYIAKHRAERRERQYQRKLAKANSTRLVPVTNTAEETGVADAVDAQIVAGEENVVDVVELVGRVEPDYDYDSEEEERQRRNNSFTDLSRLGVRDQVLGEAARRTNTLREEVPKLAVKKGPPVQLVHASKPERAPPAVEPPPVQVALVTPTRECICGKSVLESQWTEHQTMRCSLRAVPCRAGCGLTMQARGREAHERSHCRLIMCVCGKMVLTPSLDLHRMHECLASVSEDDRPISPRAIAADRDPVVPCRLSGCGASMRASRREAHERTDCMFRLVLCPRCGAEKPAGELDAHVTNECTQRRQSQLALCACGKMVLRESMEAHQLNDCSRRRTSAAPSAPKPELSDAGPPVLVPCRLPGCIERMTETQRENHERNDCDFRRVTCSRCSAELPAVEVDQHVASECAQWRQSQLSLCACGKLVMKGAAHSCTATAAPSEQTHPLLVACRLPGCSAKMRAARREAHERHECPFRMTKCPQCGVERHAADMEAHQANECALQRAQQSVQRSMSAFAPPSVVVPKLNKKSIKGPPSPSKKGPAISKVIDIADEGKRGSSPRHSPSRGSPPRASHPGACLIASALPGSVQATDEALKLAEMRKKVLARRGPRASKSPAVAPSLESPTKSPQAKPQLLPPQGRPIGPLFSAPMPPTSEEVVDSLAVSPIRRKMMSERGGPPASSATIVPSPREDEVAAAVAAYPARVAARPSTPSSAAPAPVTRFTLEDELTAAENETKPPAPRGVKGPPKPRPT